MNEDKELLILAAKAAGIEIISDAGEKGIWIKHKFLAWNPLTDDGDALRLAVKLGITVEFFADEVWAFDDDHTDPIKEIYGNDPYAATRRCIVRAAAAIGESLDGNKDSRP
jgi:hypothetical protein